MNEKNNYKKNSNDIKLPLINNNQKNSLSKVDKSKTNKNKESSSSSIISQNSQKVKQSKNTNTLDKTPQSKENIKTTNTINTNNTNNTKLQRQNTNKSNESGRNIKTNDKINDIISTVNKNRNINTKVINNNNNNYINSFHTNESDITQKQVIKRKKYKFRIYKPLNPLLAPHDDMSFFDKHNTKENFYKNLSNSMPKMTKEKLNEIKERRIARIKREKRGIENTSMKIMDEIKGQNSIIKSGEIVLNDILSSINTTTKISHKNAQKILEDGGMIEAYKYLIKNLCKNGMPEGNVYDYCSDFIKNFEKVWQRMKFKMLNKKIEEHFREKKELYIKNNENTSSNKYYKVLEQREEMQFIKKLDKSRSSLHVVKRNKYLVPEVKKINEVITNIKTNKNDIILNSKEENKNNIINNINNINMNMKGNKSYDRRIVSKLKINNEQYGELNDKILSNKISPRNNNKVTFNIQLKKKENEDEQKIPIKENTEINKTKKVEEEKQKTKSNSKEKTKLKEIPIEENEITKNDKGEIDISENNSYKINNPINNIKKINNNNQDNKSIVQKEKKKPLNKKGKSGKEKQENNKVQNNSGK